MRDHKAERVEGLFLISPAGGCEVEGRGVLFRWELRDLPEPCSASRLTIRRRKHAQNRRDAAHDDDLAFEVEIPHRQFYVLETASLGDLSGDFVWQVLALATSEDGTQRLVATSEQRSFRHARARSGGHDGFTPAEGRLDQVADEPRDERDRLLAQTLGLSCANGDFETGNLSGWVAYCGSRANSATIMLNNLQTGAINGRHTIRSVADGDDPTLLPSVHLPQVGEGSYSLRLGDSNTQAQADLVSYTFVVDMQNRFFTSVTPSYSRTLPIIPPTGSRSSAITSFGIRRSTLTPAIRSSSRGRSLPTRAIRSSRASAVSSIATGHRSASI